MEDQTQVSIGYQDQHWLVIGHKSAAAKIADEDYELKDNDFTAQIIAEDGVLEDNDSAAQNAEEVSEFEDDDSASQIAEDSDSDDEELVSDCESCVTKSDDDEEEGDEELQVEQSSVDGLVRLDEYETAYMAVKHKFMSNLGDLAKTTTVVAIHKKNWADFCAGKAEAKARVNLDQCYEAFVRALSKECEDVVNLVKYAWYGGSKNEIARIMSHGFSHHEIRDNLRLYGRGFCLSPVDSPTQSVHSCVIDDDGLRHVLLCRVLLKSTDFADSGSSQYDSSSDEVDYEVDDVLAQSKHIVSHILPEYVISFKAPLCLEGFSKAGHHVLKKPTSPWMAFPTLLSTLSKFMPQPKFNLINKHYMAYKKRKISRREFILNLRLLAGDDILVKIIKSLGAKATSSSSSLQ